MVLTSLYCAAVSVYLLLSGVLVCGDCPSGWLKHDLCYLFSDNKLSWTGAMTMCNLLGGRLAEVQTTEQMEFLDGMAKQLRSDFWIGAHDVVQEGKFVWATSHLPVTVSHYARGEPNDAHHSEDCLEIHPDSTWNDGNCMSPLRYICEIPSSGGEQLFG